jgi:membrane fusion protein (multidrug efflux system)
MNDIASNLGRIGIVLLITLIIFSCGEKKQAAPPPPEIPVVEVLKKDVPLYRQFVGQVYGQSDIPIRARVAGFLEGVHFAEGMPVHKGQLLYSIDPEEFLSKVATQESHLAQAKTELAKTASDLSRVKPLAEINAVSQSDLDAAQANYDASVAYVDAMEANLHFAKINLGYCTIYSPIDGLIGKTNARIGEFVGKDPNPVILNTVSTVDTVRVEFYISEAQYIRLVRESRRIRDIDKGAKIQKEQTLSLILADGSIFNEKGFVNFINREVDPQTGSLLVQTTFPNSEGLLKPGQYAKVVIKLKNINDGLLIPQRCVMELQGQYSVFVVDSDNKVQSRQIVIGDDIGDMVVVEEGLKEGEKVVIDALQKVATGLEVIPKLTVFESQTNSQF